MHGFILVDKPEGYTSHDVVGRLRKLLKIKRIGHAGTLDPFATGILPIAVGEATKALEYISNDDKAYVFTIKFGIKTDTYDITGKIVETTDYIPSKDQFLVILNDYMGEISQTPPKYSAISINGRRAYDMARNNEEFELKPRQVTIHNLELRGFSEEKGEAILYAKVSKGTYIRSLASDIAESLGSLGTVSVLRRVQFGKFVDNKIKLLDKISEMVHNDDAGFLLDINLVLDDILGINVSQAIAKRLLQGQKVRLDDITLDNDTLVRILFDSTLISISKIMNHSVLVPVKNFNIINI